MPYTIERAGKRAVAGTKNQVCRDVTNGFGTTGRIERQDSMGRLIKAVAVLVLLGFVGLVAYAYLAVLSPDAAQVTLPVTLHAD